MNTTPTVQFACQLSQIFEKYGHLISVKKGQTVYTQEDIAGKFFLVKSGTLRSYVIGEHGRDITLEQLNPGKMFGSASFFLEIPRFASVIALEDSTVISLDSNAIKRCFGDHYPLASEIFQSLGLTIQFLVAQVESLAIISANQRIAHTLLKLALDFKKDSSKEYLIPYTHQQIAELVGLSRPTTTYELNILESAGLIQLGYRKIIVKNIDQLKLVTSSIK